MPITDLPGITSTTRTLITARERARSFARFVMRLTLMPGAGCTSKRVITGPGRTSITSTSMPKSWSFISSRRESASRDSRENPLSLSPLFLSSRSSVGNSSPKDPRNKEVCFSFSARLLFFVGFSGGEITGSLRIAIERLFLATSFFLVWVASSANVCSFCRARHSESLDRINS